MIVRAVYVLSSSGVAFRALLAEVLHDLSYIPSKIYPAVFMWQAVKNNGFRYYEYVLCYVDDVICISDNPSATMFGLKETFKLKDDI